MARRAALAATHCAVGALTYAIGYRTAIHDANDPASAFEAETKREALMKDELLDHLRHRSFVKLSSSRVAGVGCIAVTDIPQGVDPFTPPNQHLSCRERSVTLTGDELMTLPSAVVDHILDFHDSRHAQTIQGRLYPPFIDVNACGMVSMDASWYLNHAEEPNMERYTKPGSDAAFVSYRTTRPVRAGEELLLDYRKAIPGVYAHMNAQLQQQQGDQRDAHGRARLQRREA